MQQPSPPHRCAIYTRQSRPSATDFTSCEAQFESCQAFIQSNAYHGWTFDNVRRDDEGRSGEDPNRPTIQRLLADAKAGLFDRLVIYRLDRLSRKVYHCAFILGELRRLSIPLTIVTQPEIGTSAADMLIINLMASFAEFESEIIRDRLRDARGALKRRGQRVAGKPPFGYTTDPRTKQFVPDRAEAPRAIADHANRYGWRTKATTSRSTGKSHAAQATQQTDQPQHATCHVRSSHLVLTAR